MKSITDISYDNAGNPLLISFANGRNISNVYSSTGERLKTVSYGSLISQSNPMATITSALDPLTADAPESVVASGVLGQLTVEYHGPVIYRNGTVDMVLFPGGYATLSGSNVTFHYFTQDYLGNNRAVINGSTGAIEQTVAYYPYGGVIADLGNPTMGQPYKFGGKELLTANGLNEYDFGARRYFQAVPHFTSIDPLCEVRPDLSPYLFCGNDPVNNVDPSGMVFTEASEKYINNFLKNIDSRIQSNNAKIEKSISKLNGEGLSAKQKNKIQGNISKLQASNASLAEVKSEISILRESTQVYNVCLDNSLNTSSDPYGLSGEIVSTAGYNEKTDMFDIKLGDESLGMLAHELKHAYQFETGDFSSGRYSNGEPFYDLTDEFEAYERGYMFGQPQNNRIAQQYHYLQRNPSGVCSLTDVIKCNNVQLQKYANRSHSTFRWKGSTYKGKR